MKVLFINSCIRENSRTKRLCDMFIEKRLKNEDIKEQVLQDIGILPFNRKMLDTRACDIAETNFGCDRYSLARDLCEAQILLIAAPYWDCSFPSVLKAYIEHICVDGLTFVYNNGVPVKRNSIQKMIYITSSGGYMPKNSSLELYLRELCGLLCIPELEFHYADGLDIWGTDVDSVLENTAKSF